MSAPYQTDLARLRLDKLRLEEDHLIELKRQAELERIRGPQPKWYFSPCFSRYRFNPVAPFAHVVRKSSPFPNRYGLAECFNKECGLKQGSDSQGL
jgi:hypothetical protein